MKNVDTGRKAKYSTSVDTSKCAYTLDITANSLGLVVHHTRSMVSTTSVRVGRNNLVSCAHPHEKVVLNSYRVERRTIEGSPEFGVISSPVPHICSPSPSSDMYHVFSTLRSNMIIIQPKTSSCASVIVTLNCRDPRSRNMKSRMAEAGDNRPGR